MMGTVCFEGITTTCICNAQNFGIWGIMGTGGQNTWSKVPYLESPTLICLFTICNFYGATMMIKGSLLLSAPIVKHFRSKKTCPVLGQNLTVLGINNGLKLNLSFINPKTHILA